MANKAHPYNIPVRRSPLAELASASRVGALGAVSVAVLYPRLPSLRLTTQLKEILPLVPLLETIPGAPRLYACVATFVLLFTAGRGAGYLRLVLLRKLLAWHGWITNPRSIKTKVWGKVLQLLRGPGPFKTSFFQPLLPKQPLPDLDDTLDRWLTVSKPVLTPDEFAATRLEVENFRHHDGPAIQAFLRQKAEKDVSWISEYWLTAAYLSNRSSLAVNSNYISTSSIPPHKTSSQMAQSVNVLYYFCQLADHIRNEDLQPDLIQNLVPLCMSGYTFVYNCNRHPGDNIDVLKKRPEGRNVIFLRRGLYFNVEMYVTDKSGRQTPLTQHEIQAQLNDVIRQADQWHEENPKPLPPVAALTGQARNVWAKHRRQLIERNQTVMDLIEKSMFIFELSDHEVKDFDDFSTHSLVGDGANRWFDKCFHMVVFPNGLVASNCEHSFYDATVFNSAAEYLSTHQTYQDGEILPSSTPLRKLVPPQRLSWDVTGMEDKVNTAYQEVTAMAQAIELYYLKLPYGKGKMKKAGLSPDGYIQMAMQYAYYKMYGRVTKTYEPASSRLFALGRTETVHPVSEYSVAWLKAMKDEKSTADERRKLLSLAVKTQTRYRQEATIGQGCDRHLLALMCASREMGMDLPKIFTDKAWTSPFKLSTSQVPTQLYEYQADDAMVWETVTGLFGPVCEDGYGVCYTILGDNLLQVNIASWRTCAETDSRKFGKCLTDAMNEILELFTL